MPEIDPPDAPSEFSLRIGELFGRAVTAAVADLYSKGIPSCTLRDGKVVYDYPPDPVRVPADVLERMARPEHPEAEAAWAEFSRRQAAGEAVACVRHGQPMWVILETDVDRWLAYRRGDPSVPASVVPPLLPPPTLSLLGPQCPHCGDQIHFDDGGLPSDEDWSHVIACEECGRSYRWRARISVEYTTQAVHDPA